MKVLFLGPLPPPINGHSLASRVLLEALVRDHEVDVIDLGRDSAHTGAVSGRRIRAVVDVLRAARTRRSDADAIYLTISESLAGNLKDLLIYLLCATQLRRICLHLHGGSIKRELFDRHRVLRHINAFFIKRVGAVIVCGRSHIEVFESMIAGERIHVIPNFAENDLFLTDEEMRAKWSKSGPLKILFLSGMVPRKGYLDLTTAYLELPPSIREEIQIDFAGQFESAVHESSFAARIADVPNLRYHGVVAGAEKRQLFADAHVFCLPTAFLEGQPISILEAYATGCVVVTTGQPGIRDIFSAGANGFEIEAGSSASIRAAIEQLLRERERLSAIGLQNRKLAATSFTTSLFSSAVAHVLESLANPVK
jgi:glycosyltransferase involved in cell wall biosynthesis